MTATALRLDLARLSLAATLSEFPEFRARWRLSWLLSYAAGRCSFREAAVAINAMVGGDR